MRAYPLHFAICCALLATICVVEPSAAQTRPRRTQATAPFARLARGTKPARRREASKPRVELSAAHRQSCRILVGDVVPAVTVTDFAGRSHAFADLLSDQLTVLIFWQESSPLSLEQFRRIPVEILGDFARHRVKVIAAHVGGDAERTRVQTGDAADKIVSLVDGGEQFFQKFANQRGPRVYLLDAQGKILWFDIEYAPATVRSLRHAISYYIARTDS